MKELYIGLMSGTSLDGVDGVLVQWDAQGLQVVAHEAAPFCSDLRDRFLELNRSGPDELHRSALAANALVQVYSDVVQRLLHPSRVTASQVRAIGAHGQTVRHQPGMHDGVGYTVQLNNPALLAERTGICVVADFRSRDVAAGGQGAPLVPAFHQQMFGQAGTCTCVLNIGGISNLSVLHADASVLGFDCGPGNVLLDHWCLLHTGQRYDDRGQWAAQGRVHAELLARMLAEPFFALPPPKSTGRDLFHAQWLSQQLLGWEEVPAVDVQATLTALTAQSIAQDVQRHAADAQELVVCGGGALNDNLMCALQATLPSVRVRPSQERGLPPLQVEATAFAWLARQTMHGKSGNLQSVTGARGPRVLGAIYPA